MLPLLAGLLLTACEKAAVVDRPAAEIRGQPINAPVTNTSAAKVAAPAAKTGQTTNFATIGFDKLSGYDFALTDNLLAPATNNLAAATAMTEAQIPPTVKAFDQKRVAVSGFMLPLKVEGGAVTELLVMKDQSMCCYGATPKINEWISVKMKGAGVKPIMDQTVTLFGTLRVGEMRENGYLVGIYSLEGERMEEPAEH